MDRIELYINGKFLTENQIVVPSFRNRGFEDRIKSREKFVHQKQLQMRLEHYPQMRFNDFHFVQVFESRMDENAKMKNSREQEAMDAFFTDQVI